MSITQAPRLPVRRTSALVACCLALVGALTACAGEPDTDVGPGTVVGGVTDTTLPLATRVEARLPAGMLAVHLADGGRFLPEEGFESPEGLPRPTAPEGKGWFLVQVERSDPTPEQAGDPDRAVADVEVSVRDGSSEYPVPSLGRLLSQKSVQGGLYAVVVDDPDSAALVLTIGGETQVLGRDGTVDLGRVGALESARPQRVSCGALRGPGPDLRARKGLEAECTATVAALPYLSGVGWAADGHVFVVVDVGASPPRAVERRSNANIRFSVDASGIDVTLDGEEPIEVERAISYLGSSETAIFDVEGRVDGTMQVRNRGLVDVQSGRGPTPGTQLEWRWTTSLDLVTGAP